MRRERSRAPTRLCYASRAGRFKARGKLARPPQRSDCCISGTSSCGSRTRATRFAAQVRRAAGRRQTPGAQGSSSRLLVVDEGEVGTPYAIRANASFRRAMVDANGALQSFLAPTPLWLRTSRSGGSRSPSPRPRRSRSRESTGQGAFTPGATDSSRCEACSGSWSTACRATSMRSSSRSTAGVQVARVVGEVRRGDLQPDAMAPSEMVPALPRSIVYWYGCQAR